MIDKSISDKLGVAMAILMLLLTAIDNALLMVIVYSICLVAGLILLGKKIPGYGVLAAVVGSILAIFITVISFCIYD